MMYVYLMLNDPCLYYIITVTLTAPHTLPKLTSYQPLIKLLISALR